MIQATREQRRQLARDNAKFPIDLQEIPPSGWTLHDSSVTRVWRSRRFLVQERRAVAPAVAFLAVCRTEVRGDRWADGISWDELQEIKRQCGYGDADAVEIYPRDDDVVNVANMRHLWILKPGSLPFAWRRR